jgi:dTDP-4-dehydrorhamnose 3,5-epimerase
MKIINTKFNGLKIIETKNFYDKRGHFREIFKTNLLNKNKFIFGCASSSKKNVLRGLHFQTKKAQGKLVSVLKGKILDIAVDLRKNSKTFGKYFKIIISDKDSKSIFIPPGFAHGFLGLNKTNIIYYLCTNYRSEEHENGIIWNDKQLKISWPISNPILSKKDKKNITFLKYKEFYL